MKLRIKIAIGAAALLLSAAQCVAADPAYRIIDLGSLGGGYADATDVNNFNQATGRSNVNNSVSSAFLYDNGMTGLGAPFNLPSRGLAINDYGQIVGDAAFESANYTAYIAQNGVVTNIGTLGGPSSQARAINNHEVVVGTSQFDPMPTGPWIWPAYIEFDQRYHAFIYQDGGMQDLHVLAGLQGDNSAATGINDHGHVIGTIDNRGFIYADGQLIELHLEPSRRFETISINNSGAVLLYEDDADGNSMAYIYNDSSWTPLGSLGGDESIGYDMNDAGTVVGSSTTGEFRELIFSPVSFVTQPSTSGHGEFQSEIEWLEGAVLTPADPIPVLHAFIYQDGQMTDLNSLIRPDSGWELTHANGINAKGVIVGSGYFEGESRAFMLIPIPEPTSAMLLMIVLAISSVHSNWRNR